MIDKTSEPAFPTDSERQIAPNACYYEDMSLRDWFAGQALAGQCAYEGMEGCDAKLIAGCAYEMADAMMRERAK